MNFAATVSLAECFLTFSSIGLSKILKTIIALQDELFSSFSALF